MSFLIAPFPGQTYAPRYASHHDIRAYLGFGELVEYSIPGLRGAAAQPTMALKSTRLPLDFTASNVLVPLVDGRSALLHCGPGHRSDIGRRGKSSAHRCKVRCPDCGVWVPAGRTHQHKCK